MFDPPGTDYYDEFIEIFNLDSIPVDLSGMSLKINDATDFLDDPQGRWSIEPHSWGIILDRGYLVDHQSDTYETLIPSNTARFTIKDASFGKSGLNNTSANIIKLITATGDTLCTVVTTPDQPSGYSDEKILIGAPDDTKNWGNSRVLLGTPGKRNSITPHDWDLSLSALRIKPEVRPIKPQQPLEIQIVVRNVGLLACDYFEIFCGEDLDSDSELAPTEVLFYSSGSLPVGDSVQFQTTLLGLSSGEHQFLSYLAFPADQYEVNDLKSLTIPVAYPRGCLIINEFMYYPSNDGTGEWVEVFNISPQVVNLKNWSLGDQSNRLILTKNDFYLPPQKHLVIANDSSLFKRWQVEDYFLDAPSMLPTLNNSGDSIVLRDLCGIVIDSLYYSSKWGYQQGISLERKNPYRFSTSSNNWGLSQSPAGATPGSQNSIILKRYNLSLDSIRLSSTEPLRVGTPCQITIFISNRGLDTLSAYTVHLTAYRKGTTIKDTIYHTSRSVSFLLPPYEHIIEYFDWVVPCGGVLTLAVEIQAPDDEDTSDNSKNIDFCVGFTPNALIINEIMYQPASGAPEWFEVFNPTSQTVDLNRWLWRKGRGSWYQLCDSALLIPPSEYLIVAANNHFMTAYPDFPGRLHVPPNFPSLNNTSDSLFLRDAIGQIQELVRYDYRWGGKENISIERRNPYKSALTAHNWGSSLAPQGATPGTINSIACRQYDLALDTVYTIPEKIHYGENVSVRLTVRNAGLEVITNGGVQLEVNYFHNSSPLQRHWLPITTPLLTDSVLTLSTNLLLMTGGLYQLTAWIVNSADQNAANDTSSCLIRVGAPPQSIYLSEIYYKPKSGEVEWFELYNAGSVPVNLQGWQFRNAFGNWLALTDSLRYLSPDSYIVVAAHAQFVLQYPDFQGNYIIPLAFPNLNNTSDSLLIRDAAGLITDKAYYRDLLGSKTGISIEKDNLTASGIDPAHWFLSQAPNGATPGQRNSVQRWDYDLAIQQFAFDDTVLESPTAVSFNLTIKNVGLQTVAWCDIQLFEGVATGDTFLFPELVWSKRLIVNLSPDSQITVSGNIYASRHGSSPYLCSILLDDDQNLTNNTLMRTLVVGYTPKSIIINEFLAAPQSNQVEFIEVFNPSPLTVNTTGWCLKNHYKSAYLPPHYIKPGEYLVLSGDSAFFNYFDCPSPVLIVPKWPGFNNTADDIILLDIAGINIDSLQYTSAWKIAPGYSWEKILPSYPSNQATSWKMCVAPERATPGRLNSITPLTYDISLDSVLLSPLNGDTNTIFTATIYYRNIGQQSCPAIELIIGQLIGNRFSPLVGQNLPSLAPLGTGVVAVSIGRFPSGRHILKAYTNWSDDQNRLNDTLTWTIQVAYPAQTILITEFMPYPFDLMQPHVSNSEYIEIYNPGRQPLDLTGWMISDNNTARKISIPDNKSITPDGYLVIAADSSIFNFSSASPLNTIVISKFPALNNNEDEIYLYDPTGQVIDELHYLPTWPITKGLSLERIDWRNPNQRANWCSSLAVQGGTPGLPNSVKPLKPLSKPGLVATPQVFTPNGDKSDDQVKLQYQLPYASALLTLEIYNLEGRLICRPARNLTTAAEGVIYWDGCDDNGSPARIGLYLARCLARDLGGTQNVEYITTFVLVK